MRNPRIDYTVVGAFVLTIVAAILVTVVMLTGNTGPTDRYETVYNNVAGLKYGTQVLYEGYPVGQVETVEPFEDAGRIRFRIVFSVTSGWKIPDDSIAQMTAAGLLSAMTISIQAGDSSTPLPPGGQLTGGESADLFAAMSSVAAEFTALSEEEIKPFLRQLGGTVGKLGTLLGEDGHALAASLRGIVDDIATRAPEIIERVARITVQLEDASSEIGQLLNAKNRSRVTNTLANFETTSLGFIKLLTTLDLTRAQLDALLSDLHGVILSNGPEFERSARDLRHVAESLASHIDRINANLAAASRNINEFSREIRQNPGLLLGSKPLPDEARQ